MVTTPANIFLTFEFLYLNNVNFHKFKIIFALFRRNAKADLSKTGNFRTGHFKSQIQKFRFSKGHTPYPSKQTLLVLFLYVKNKMAPKNKMACRKKASSKVTSMDYYFENVLAV